MQKPHFKKKTTLFIARKWKEGPLHKTTFQLQNKDIVENYKTSVKLWAAREDFLLKLTQKDTNDADHSELVRFLT